MKNKGAASPYTTTSAGDTLEYKPSEWKKWQANDFQPAILIAPTKAIQKQWRKDYPGIEVLLAQKLPIAPTKPTNKQIVGDHGADRQS